MTNLKLVENTSDNEVIDDDVKIKTIIAKMEVPLLLDVGGSKLGKVRVYSRDASFDKLVDTSYTLEKMIGSEGHCFVEITMLPHRIKHIKKILVQDPW
jgi:hypothetical protein